MSKLLDKLAILGFITLPIPRRCIREALAAETKGVHRLSKDSTDPEKRTTARSFGLLVSG